MPAHCTVCAVPLATYLLFDRVPARCVVLRVRCPWPLGSCPAVCLLGVWCCFCDVLGHFAAAHRCARSCVLCCLCSVLGHLAPVHRCARLVCCVCGVLRQLAAIHRCARSVCCVACAVSLATWLLFTGVHAGCAVCAVSLVNWLLFTGVHARCAVCAVSLATWFLFTGVSTGSVVLRVQCPWPLGSCSPLCPLDVLCCVCGVPGYFAPVHRSARSVCCVTCALSLATWFPFTVVPAWRVVLRVRCPWPLGSCSPVCTLGVLCVRCP